MTGNAYVLLALVEAMMSFLTTADPEAARRSRTIVRRASGCQTAVTGMVKAFVRGSLAGRIRTDDAGSNTACAGEAP